jgi:site-specific DNA recombinase
MISDSRYGCAAARNSGTCENRKTIKRTAVEDRVLAGLKQRLMHPDLIAEFIAEYQRERHRERLARGVERVAAERRLAKAEKDIEAIIKAITDGLYHPSMKAKMDLLKAERAAAQVALSVTPLPDEIPLHPGLAAVYARKVADLAASLNHDSSRHEAAALLRGLIEKVTLLPDANSPNGHVIELFGELGAILSLCSEPGATKAKARSGATGVRQLTMVAGAGFEPAAFRL